MIKKERRKGCIPGLRVLDLADEKGSFCSKILADWGAYVVKLERPGGDPSRTFGSPPASGLKPGLFFSYHNTNKLGITLNLEHLDGRKIFRQLVKKFDVVVECFPPGYLRRLNLGYPSLRRENRHIILVSITGFGQTGPRSLYKSCDLVASAYGGPMSVTGSPEAPQRPFGEQTYYTASLFAAVAVMLSLRKRTATRRGMHIDISLQEAAAATLEDMMAQYFGEGKVLRRAYHLDRDHSFKILACKDGYLLFNPMQRWDTLVGWLDAEGAAADLTEEAYQKEEHRWKKLGHVLEVFQSWAKKHTVQELFESGQLMHFPWGPVLSPGEVLETPQVKSRNFFQKIFHPELGRALSHPGAPFTVSGAGIRKRAPRIGEDNEQVYREILGLSKGEVQRLCLRGAV